MTLLHSLPVLELRSMPQGVVDGIAASFNGIDFYGDSILPGAFSQTLREHEAAGTAPAMLWSHQMGSPVGRWEKLVEDQRGLRVTGRLNLKTSAGREAFEHLHAGDINGLSIGYTVPRGGEAQRGEVREVRQVTLHEVSLVTLPADAGARVTAVKACAERPETLRQFQTALQAMGFSRREAARIAEKGFDFEPDESDEHDLLALLGSLRAFQTAMKGSR